MLKEDILNLILQAESEYHGTVRNALKEAEKYVDGCKEKQSAYIEDLKQEWHLSEEAESEQFGKTLSEDEQKMEAEIAELKKRLKICQEKKMDSVSERLKKEVLSVYGNR